MKSIYFILFVTGLASSFFLALLIEPEYLRSLTIEDGLVENLGALAFFLAGLVFLYLFFKDPDGNHVLGISTRRNVFHLLLALLFFFAAGEEISWGQRILSIETPEAIAEMNLQKETNLHNLAIFHGRDAEGDRKVGPARFLSMNMLFSLFWFSYCVLLPIAASISARCRAAVERWNLALFSVPVGSLFLLNYLFSKTAEGLFGPRYQHDIIEIKETNFGILFLVAGCTLLILRARQAEARPIVPRPAVRASVSEAA